MRSGSALWAASCRGWAKTSSGGNPGLNNLTRLASLSTTKSQRWHVSTAGYLYRLDDVEGNELVSWHWHTATKDYPHLHVGSGVLDKRTHLPTWPGKH